MFGMNKITFSTQNKIRQEKDVSMEIIQDDIKYNMKGSLFRCTKIVAVAYIDIYKYT